MMWKPVPEFNTYEASDKGFVRNAKTGKVLKNSVHKDGTGMPCVSLVGDKTYIYEVRYVIASTFLGVDIFANPKTKLEYIDGDKFNNSVENIRIKELPSSSNTQEVWKPVKDFEDSYAISNLGRVKRLERTETYTRSDTKKAVTRKVAPQIVKVQEKDDYYEINLRNYGKNEWRRVHRMVAEAFISNPNNLPQVNHINGNKHDNRVENLEWCTSQENVQHSLRTGLRGSQKDTNHTPKQLTCVDTGQVFNSIKEAANYFNISINYLSERVLAGKPCHNLHFELSIKDIRVKCLDTGQIFPTIASAQEHFGIGSIADSIRRRTCNNGWTFCYMRDNVDEVRYLEECRVRYSMWPRANKRWENQDNE